MAHSHPAGEGMYYGAGGGSEAAWQAVHGDRLHTLVGKTAKRAAFAARWMPGKMRKMARSRAEGPMGGR